MAEFLIRVTDKVNADVYQNAKCTKRGDVIVVQPDGWTWGSEELTAPFWRIVKHAGITVSAGSALLAPELDVNPSQPSRMLQRRAFKLNLDAASLPQSIKNFIADNTRAVPILDISGVITVAQFNNLKVVKQALQDPNIIG